MATTEPLAKRADMAQSERPMHPDQYHGRCRICEAPARKHPEFCYVHECYVGASEELVRKAQARRQLELERERAEQIQDRTAVRLEWERNQ